MTQNNNIVEVKISKNTCISENIERNSLSDDKNVLALPYSMSYLFLNSGDAEALKLQYGENVSTYLFTVVSAHIEWKKKI